jgi:GNAT superfamily N-acetyltransferase
VSSYRFCRTDDIQLLVEALNQCWLPYFPDDGPMTAVAFKRSIRDLQVWCSSCMVAFSGSDPVGVLIGAKRASGTLIHKIAVHPDHRRQGHGRHLLASIASKLAILGPPRIVAEVPEPLIPARALFAACGYVEEAALRDYALAGTDLRLRHAQEHSEGSAGTSGSGNDRGGEGWVIPFTVDDLTANSDLAHEAQQACWKRSLETLSARKDEIAGIAVASDERIEAYLLYIKDGYIKDGLEETEIVSFHSSIDDGGTRLRQLLLHLHGRGVATVRLPKVHPVEVPGQWLQKLGFSAAGEHVLFAATARPA